MKNDAHLQRETMDELRWEPSLEASAIGVAVEEGVVTLTGHVANHLEKCAAERAARRVAGVKGVANEIEVRLSGREYRDDADIARAAVHALEWDSAIPHGCLQVVVNAGWVTLEGRLEWTHQKDAAEADMRRLAGVRGVTNAILVEPQAESGDLEQLLTRALGRAAGLNAARIQAESSDGRVCLRGYVRSWTEREEAERTARAAPGVADVENHLVVAP